MAKTPDRIVLKRHRDFEGIAGAIWVRRVILMMLGVVTVLALLNVFGQHPVSARAEGAAAALELQAPTRLRGGLLYTARFTIRARTELEEARLVLDPGWAENITINTIEPAPVGEASDDGKLSLTLGRVPAGGQFRLYMDFQVNPTAVGSRRQNVELRDGETPVASLSRSLFIFP